MDRIQLYRDIARRTDGDIYLGVVGPVRTGKSTFIKRFMDTLVLPDMENEHEKERLTDELPQSAAGKTIMTTQPKFVPNEAAELVINENMSIRVRMVDCVGYMIPGAVGHIEGDLPRMVRTPWFDHDIPFEEAAEIGTKKVITEHSTIGVVVTTDGSITGIERSDYVAAEERVVDELKSHGKPFIVVLNSTHPDSDECIKLAATLSEAYDAAVCPVDVINMTAGEIYSLLESVLLEFPIRMVRVSTPSWLSALSPGHWLARRLVDAADKASQKLERMRDCEEFVAGMSEVEGFEAPVVRRVELGSGALEVDLRPVSNLFYTVLGEECGCEIHNDAHLISLIKDFVEAKREYDRVSGAIRAAHATGYGMVQPALDEMTLDAPETVQQGSRFGVRLRARASGMHMIRVDIESEVAPLVGSEQQADEFLSYLTAAYEGEPNDIWNTNIFGKSLHDMVRESMSAKMNRLPDEVQRKLQCTVQRMVNEGCNGLICIML